MVWFRFRLEASLRLAEQALETAQQVFAQEVQHWQTLVETCAIQLERFNTAQEGQRDACKHRPEELGMWQIFVLEQLRRLRQVKAEQLEQEMVMENARRMLLEAHREMEKFSRLKEKQAKAFQLAESQKEQKSLDETGQIIHWRQQSTSSKY